MRAAVDVTPLIGSRTGIGELVAGLVDALQGRTDIEVIPVALTWRGRGEAGAHHRPIPARAVQRLWSHTDLAPVTWWTGPVDVIHGTNYVVGPGPRRRPGSHRRRTARIVTVHDLAVLHTPELCHPSTLVFPRLIQRAVATGAMVQTDSQATARQVQDWLGIDPSRIRHVYPGLTQPPPALGRSDADAPPALIGTRFVLTLGTEEPRKGLARMMSALPALLAADPDLRWVHAGGSGWGSAELDRLAADLRPAERAAFHRLGRVTDAQKWWLLRHAAVFVYPSVDEGFGFPPLEAMAVGTPTVCADLPVLREIAGAPAAFVDPSDHDQFVATVLVESERHDEQSAEQRRAHAAQFEWRRTGSDQVQWYHEAIELTR